MGSNPMIFSKSPVFADTRALLIALLCLFNPGAGVRADDGGISFGGSPHLLKGHSSVTMESEVVSIDVHDKVIKVDCRFLFHNHGPKCIVRMGFPDQGLGASEPYQGFPVPKGPGLKATFITYDSYVDGKKVPTKLVPTNDRSLYWHTKTVTFKANSDCNIRDVYTLPPGAQVTSENGLYNQTYYVLHTGASWHGPIGKAEINVKFEPDVLSQPIHLMASNALPEGQKFPDLKWSKLPTGTVIYSGPSEPKIEGKTLSFTKTNFRPDEKDDVHLFYGYRQLTNM
ncbi:MAG: hypothetical protein C5B53_04750 [Candidatus Melainabacteria bacterium]|nr:MAG: hypothetical protein C5B53_04750 [Candidatus Melainabacteria bacterium]